MKTIKIRFWNGKKMLYKDLFGIPKDISYIGEPMLFTGLLDWKGREIYEGDILQTKELGINMKWVVEIPRVYLTLLPFGKIRQDNSLIIGNIYENPELLNNN